MAAIVNLGGIVFGGSSNQVGVFSGQNMQNGWDANSPNLSLLGTNYGQFAFEYTMFGALNTWMAVGQPTLDNDLKNNATPMLEGP
ncbi:hypothetical protein [Alicyclobacillus herbarius]|uniref:hypothetical protein n=1 Tax=Alicyclobacillus herbarius TaxID=122960 RepID=UPI000429DBE8|nr:hypothetical protein [Alicyclobacillus herbarius]